jgi:hypothetical protein
VESARCLRSSERLLARCSVALIDFVIFVGRLFQDAVSLRDYTGVISYQNEGGLFFIFHFSNESVTGGRP